MSPHKSGYLSGGLAVAGFLVMLIGQGMERIGVGVLGLLLMVAGVVVQLIFWRCPSCGRYLGRSSDITYCPHCGEPL